jgi:hypothetical protein
VPRKVDYASRFALFREAAFDLVLERGVDTLSRRALAQQVGLSRARVDELLRADVPLAGLAAQEVVERRRQGRWFITEASPLEAATRLVCSLMADEECRVDEELVWLRLVTHPAARTDLARQLDERDVLVAATLDRALELLDVATDSRAAEAVHFRALLDGLTVAAVLGRITPSAAVDVVARHVHRLTSSGR